MICKRCGAQAPDNVNFCPYCALPNQPQQNFQGGFQQSFPVGNMPGGAQQNPEEKSQKAIFILGIVAFGVDFFWTLVNGLIRLSNSNLYGDFRLVFKSLSLLTGVLVLFLSFLLVKKQNYKTILLILFIVGLLINLYEVFF